MKMKTILAVAFALVGGVAFADQILVGPTVERAKEMDGQLEFLRHCEVDRNPETADVVGETYLRGEFVPQDLKKARDFYRLAVTNAPEHVTNALKVLEFLLADDADVAADREKAIERAVRRDPKTAAEIAEIKTWIPQLREIIRSVSKFALPKDGRWKGFDLTEDWVANVRTNRTISTRVRFRDEEWVPFLQRELTADVSPDDPSREKVLTLVANAARSLWRAANYTIGDDVFAEAKALYDAGCRAYAVRWIANLGMPKPAAVPLIDEMEREADATRAPQLCRFLTALSRRNNQSIGESRRATVVTAVDWILARKFPKSDSRCLYLFLSYVEYPVIADLGRALAVHPEVDPWIWKLIEAVDTASRAWDERGGGWAKDVPKEKMEAYCQLNEKAWRLYDEVRALHPEISMCGHGEVMVKAGEQDEIDAAFARLTSLELDDWGLYDGYLFFACLPRWGGSIERLEAFAKACGETDRYDTIIPLYSVLAHFWIAHEKRIELADYFADRELFEKCDAICDHYVCNSNVVRLAEATACYMKAMMTYYAGDPSDIAKFFRGDYRKRAAPPHCMREFDWDYVQIGQAIEVLSGPDARTVEPLVLLMRSRDYEAFLSQTEPLLASDRIEDDTKNFLRTQRKIATLNSKTYNGDWIEGDLLNSGEFSSPPRSWLVNRNGGGMFIPPIRNKCLPLEWVMSFGNDYELNVTVHPVTRRCPSRLYFRYKVRDYSWTHLPEIVLDLTGEKARVEIFQANFKGKEDPLMKTVGAPYHGQEFDVRISYKDGVVRVWAGGAMAACITSDKFRDAFKEVRDKKAFISLRGNNVMVRNIKARPER